MTTLFREIQKIALNAVQATNPMSFYYGTVTGVNPLKIRLTNGTLEVNEESIILTEPVIEKKLTIKKHTHKIGSDLYNHKHPFTGKIDGTCTQAGTVQGTCYGDTDASTSLNSSTTVVDTVLEAVCTENQIELPTESNNDEIVITLNRGLEVDDKVILLSVCSAQEYIVLSRVFANEEDS